MEKIGHRIKLIVGKHPCSLLEAEMSPCVAPSCSSPHGTPAYSLDSIYVAPSPIPPKLGIHVATHHGRSSGTRPQYEYIDNTSLYKSYKRGVDIEGAITVLLSESSIMTDVNYDSTIHTHPLHVSSAATLLPEPNLSPAIWAFPEVDNKADTLTQSQMLKASDTSHFLASQLEEISGLLKMDVFNIQPMASKPAGAKLLSSIWGYHWKCSPVGEISTYKSRICVDGSQQLHNQVYWEVYAPIVSWSTICLTLLQSTILDLKHAKSTILIPTSTFGGSCLHRTTTRLVQ
jgi:hypothetical protein